MRREGFRLLVNRSSCNSATISTRGTEICAWTNIPRVELLVDKAAQTSAFRNQRGERRGSHAHRL